MRTSLWFVASLTLSVVTACDDEEDVNELELSHEPSEFSGDVGGRFDVDFVSIVPSQDPPAAGRLTFELPEGVTVTDAFAREGLQQLLLNEEGVSFEMQVGENRAAVEFQCDTAGVKTIGYTWIYERPEGTEVDRKSGTVDGECVVMTSAEICDDGEDNDGDDDVDCSDSDCVDDPACTAVFGWEDAGSGDGTNMDAKPLTVSDVPLEANCDEAFEGFIAVCWDGQSQSNENFPGEARCTYKDVPPTSCSGGDNLGTMYVCRRQ